MPRYLRKQTSKRPQPPLPVSTTIGGQTYRGSYWVDGVMVTVSYGGRERTTPIEGDAETTARMLLRELIGAFRKQTKP